MVGPFREQNDELDFVSSRDSLYTLALNGASWKRWSLYRQRAGAKKTLQWIVHLSNIETGRGSG
jgi:hypothetical protein